MSKLQERLRTASRMVPTAFVTEMHEAADALDAMEKALRELIAANNCNYDRDAMRYTGMFQRAETALARLES